MELLVELANAVKKGKSKEVVRIVQEAQEQNLSAQQILDEGLLTGMSEIGAKFKNNEVFVPEVLVAARAMNKGTEMLKEQLATEGVEALGTIVLATVQGDLHDIGKNLVRMMLEGAGFTVIDLGTDVADDAIVSAVKEHTPEILALSALLTTTMEQQGKVIKAIEDAGLREKVKIMVGGAPITQSFCEKIGADFYASDAASAAEVAKSIIAS